MSAHRAGFVALIGRPNVGKSTLLNRVLGAKLAIVSPKPQTTRHRILGILNRPGAQLLFVDTPGVHSPRHLLGQRMVQLARQSLSDADLILWVMDAGAGVTPDDRALAVELGRSGRRVVIALNKIDLVSRAELMATASATSASLPERHLVPVSARTGENVEELLTTVEAALPESPPLYPGDARTDLPEKFFAAELVREQLFLATHEEVPYQSAVVIQSFEERPGRDLVVIRGEIRVARASQKRIVIGERGSGVKEIGRRARAELERFFGTRIYLDLLVKVDPRWFQRPAALADLGL